MESYFLAPHVYPCVTEDHVVLLDLRRSKYVGLSRDQMQTVATRVKGWPLTPPASGEPGDADVRPSNARADAMFAKMLAAGMLTSDPAVGKDAKPIEMDRADTALVEDDLEVQPAVTFRHVIRFLRASLVAALEMKWRPIERIIATANARKRRRHAAAAPMDLEAARRAVGAFIRLRPLLFGAQDACLFDSIALVRYLSYYRIFPTCVIGVQTGPFAAHCWVQEGAVVFNDAPEYVRRYTPILAV
jgi:transglutaminase superfamily protein